MPEYLPPNLDIIRPILWDSRGLRLLDQRLLPWREKYLRLRTPREVKKAIKDMVVRGAPAIGITGAIGLVLGAEKIKARSKRDFLAKLKRIGESLKKARPTAVNLSWAIDRLLQKANEADVSQDEIVEVLRAEALKIWEEDIEANKAMGRLGAELIPDEATILTHCNAGALATGGYGTAIGVIRAAHEAGKKIKVLADETRPWLQGARLTAWELKKVDIPVEVIPDVAAGFLMAQGKIQVIVVGADRIAVNGDVANKIGTYSLAVLAKENNIPFYVAAPLSTIDLATPGGQEIPIEWRDPKEVLCCAKRRIAPKGVSALNPAFDITPSPYISAIITEKSVVRAPYTKGLKSLFEV
ncbi:translation initiation factor, aIF-2BI family [Thermodesulfatator indicus DSM 15286]|uniref:Methylthioribose-1-phosphate isomerase n=1 Tax=Thermodesulfatator indicus (strain DSM 15286 / JCM 11887 / CIR29812) TaxID=667014 RepID=F8A976_THEID|nr:S-methyl-5-thioribose-1-phosphate isomerase [Thermodesulfatator indicus]AEH45186.1 translation initiation factor, aIF-2BI family [Thermodesulfatator indicus DSM 15286]